MWSGTSSVAIIPGAQAVLSRLLKHNALMMFLVRQHELKVRYKHYCGHPWSSGSTIAPSAIFSGIFALLVAGISLWR